MKNMTDKERIKELENRLATVEEQLALCLTAYRILTEKAAGEHNPNFVKTVDAQA